MFKVRDRETERIYVVYHIRDDANGYPQFLIYNHHYGTWEYKSAKNFKPVL